MSSNDFYMADEEAVDLLDRLIGDFRGNEFSLDDVADSYNAHTSFGFGHDYEGYTEMVIFDALNRSSGSYPRMLDGPETSQAVAYGMDHLNDLVRRGWLVSNPDGSYSINDESPEVQSRL